MENKTWVVVTRGSKLARAQTLQTIEAIERQGASNCLFSIICRTTQGDRDQKRPLSSLGLTGVFVKELETLLLQKEAHFAVHSLKDVPDDLPPSLVLSSFLPREATHDILLTTQGETLQQLRPQAVVGVGGERRKLQLAKQRPDLFFKDIRGNIDTRLRHLSEGTYDAIVLAEAGLKRLGLDYSHGFRLPLGEFLPAAGQGIVAIECREEDKEAQQVALSVNHRETEIVALAERTFMRAMGGGCSHPLAAYGQVVGKEFSLQAMAGDFPTRQMFIAKVSGKVEEAQSLATQVAEELKATCQEHGITTYLPVSLS